MSAFKDRFIWYDLMTTDDAAAKKFYASVVGWSMAVSPLTDRGYTVLSAGDTPVGGLMNLPDIALKAGAQPGWLGYIAAEDVDAMAARVTAAGGTLHRAAEDIPGVGRFAVAADPQGAAFVLFRGTGTMPPPLPDASPGCIGWHELRAADAAAAFDFYASLFGWTKADAIDMGPMGVYQLFAIGGTVVGGMMTRVASAVPPHWMYYINVADINAAAAQVKAAGGQVLHGPMPVPGGSWILQGLDPQGAHFALTAPR